MEKEIAKIKVIKPGSNPDIDSDFATYTREPAISHVAQLYGEQNISNIVTFSTLAAKAAFKQACTIYSIPFSVANKAADTLPKDVRLKLNDVMDPKSERYQDGADFRIATSGDEWKKVLDCALAIEGRVKNTGVHACGVIMSSKHLPDVVPLQVRQNDDKVVSQWIYPELESIGLIKMDFLGLDSVDIIQHTIEYIKRSGKEVPNIPDLMQGPKDDKKTFELLGRGDTNAVFQLASPGMQDLLRRLKPTEFQDIAAINALYRPGPMGMNSHMHYADRKNGREEIETIHPDFKNSPLESILKNTYGLCVYQEQAMRIAQQICGWTLKEADGLRKVIGKKKMKDLIAMKPKFITDGENNGYSPEAMSTLWETLVSFGEYGFNLSHAVAYALNGYATAYLKANYPVEFMSSVLSQCVGDKDKTLLFLKDCQNTKLNVGSVDINTSEVNVAPNYTGKGKYDIVYGIGSIASVSENNASIIVEERNKNGLFKSVQNLVERCYPLGITGRKIYENLAYAGAFDNFGISRKSVIDYIESIIKNVKSDSTKGLSLFDQLDEKATTIDLSDYPEFDHVEKLKNEADVIGFYLTSHPLANIGNGLSQAGVTKISKVMKSNQTNKVAILGAVTDVFVKKQKNGAKSIRLTFDDGTGFLTAILSRDLVKGIDKTETREKFKKMYESGADSIPDDIVSSAINNDFVPIEKIEKNSVYMAELVFKPAYGEGTYSARINNIHKVILGKNGELPVHLRIHVGQGGVRQAKAFTNKLVKDMAKKFPGDYPIYVSMFKNITGKYDSIADNGPYIKALEEMKHKNHSTEWPPKGWEKQEDKTMNSKQKIDHLYNSIEELNYQDTGLTCDKTPGLGRLVESYIGIDMYDFGVFNRDILFED